MLKARKTWIAGLLIALTMTAAACGGGDDDAGASSNSGGGSSNTGASQPAADLTSSQVCDLVSASDAGTALGVSVTAAAPLTGGTPGCSYSFRDGSTSTMVLLSVVRTTDVNGLAGKAAFDYALTQNRNLAAGAPEEKISGIGDNAVFMSGSALNLLIVQDGGRVLTLTGKPLSKDGAMNLMKAALTKL